MGLQWVIDWFRQVAPESVRHLDNPTVEEYCAVEQERLNALELVDAYRFILKSKGETDASIARKVTLYRNSRQAQVRVSA